MKKPKNLLSRSFNPIKCKTSLRLASSRLKLLRNKKEVQVKQMKREIAQLLESGQDQTAQIRVEHVMREEKTMAAYDLLEIYCELIIARMPIIEFQKDCPIDLKEAIASIVFSSLRCGDVPELLDARKQISAKYGKEFVTAAIELRPMCGVARLLVEKLSAEAPDGQSKIKILNAIAEEHNVKWDYKSFEEKDSSGPTPIRKESQPHSETPRFEAAVQDAKISLGEGKLSSGQAEARPPGEKMSQLFQGDAASSAHAATSSAEQASVAAAELSNHGGTSTNEPPKSDVKAEGLEGPPNLNSFEQKIEASANISSSVHTKVDGCDEPDPMTSSRFEERGDDSLHNGSPFADDYIQKKEESSTEQASMAAAELSNHGGTSTTEPPKSDVYNLKAEGLGGPPNLNSFEQKIEASANISSSVHTEVDGCDEPDPMTSSSFEESGDDSLYQKKEESSVEQASVAAAELSNHGGTSTIEPPKSDVKAEGLEGPPNLNSFEQKIEASANISTSVLTEVDGCETSSRFEASGDDSLHHGSPFADDDYIQKKEESEGEMDVKEHSFIYETEAEKLGEGNFVNEPHEPDALSFDKSDLEVDEQSSSNVVKSTPPFFSSRKNSSLDVSENPTLRDDDDIFAPLTFADSSDEDMNVSLPRIQQHSEIDSKESKEEDISNESRLNFGKLTGGLRHKRHNHFPPVFKNNASTATTSTSSTTPSLVEQPTIVTLQHKKKSSGKSHLYSDSDSDTCDEEEEEEQPTIVTMQHKKKSSGKSHLNFDSDSDTCEDEEEEEEPEIKLNLGASYSELYSDDSDLDEDFPKVSHSKKSHLQSGISRRTKASSNETSSGKSDNCKQPISAAASGKSDNCKQPISVVASVETNSGKASHNTVQEAKISKPEKKASHVHPKLPDYDALVQSLRINTS